MDCNKTINFLHELKRLCGSRGECVANAANKEDCPMLGFASSRIQKSVIRILKRQSKLCKNGATNSRRKHTRRTSLRSSRKRGATQMEPRLYAEKEFTAESVQY